MESEPNKIYPHSPIFKGRGEAVHISRIYILCYALPYFFPNFRLMLFWQQFEQWVATSPQMTCAWEPYFSWYKHHLPLVSPMGCLYRQMESPSLLNASAGMLTSIKIQCLSLTGLDWLHFSDLSSWFFHNQWQRIKWHSITSQFSLN